MYPYNLEADFLPEHQAVLMWLKVELVKTTMTQGSQTAPHYLQ
jgi:hypothetical protein